MKWYYKFKSAKNNSDWWEVYNAYIQSKKWGEVRKKRLAIDKHCRFCGSTSNLHCHHIFYDRIGNEDIENDLTTFCKDCHDHFHNLKSRKKLKKPKIKDVIIQRIKKNGKRNKSKIEVSKSTNSTQRHAGRPVKRNKQTYKEINKY